MEEGGHAVPGDLFGEEEVLGRAEAVHGGRARRVVRSALGQADGARGQEGAHAVQARAAVDVAQVVVADVERPRPASQEGVEHVFPGRRVHACGVGDHAVGVEDDGADERQIDDWCERLVHALSVRLEPAGGYGEIGKAAHSERIAEISTTTRRIGGTRKQELGSVPMSTTATVVTVLAALWVGFSAFSLLRRAEWVVKPLTDYGVPRSWWTWLGAAKAAGAAGLLVGLLVPAIGVLAGICLILYFAGAVITVLRARSYSTVVFPLLYMGPVIAALVLGHVA
nr:hypothetical protein GCM10020093_010460 [Planobispora longispora]